MSIRDKNQTSMLKKSAIALGVACALGSTSLFANDMSKYDANGDGSLSRGEYHNTVKQAKLPSSVDDNGDGRLDMKEWESTNAEGDFVSWDENSDGYVDAKEFYKRGFDEYDQDENGHWDGDEWDDAGDEGFWDV